MSPTSLDESKTEGWSNLNIAIPFVPSLDFVSLTSGIVCSSVPWMNWIAGFIIIMLSLGILRVRVFLGKLERNKHKDWPLNDERKLGWTPPNAKPIQYESQSLLSRAIIIRKQVNRTHTSRLRPLVMAGFYTILEKENTSFSSNRSRFRESFIW